jgi:ABC-2 type transport system permease protein
MNHARAIVWAEWRTLWNAYSRGGVAWTAVIGSLWYGLWVFGAVAAARVVADGANTGLISTVLPGAVLLGFLYWQAVPLLLASTGASLDLRKLQAYPVPEGQLFLIEVLLRVTGGLEILLLVTSVAAGILLNPALRAWGALGAVPFVAFNLLLAVGVRDLVGRILSNKRVRELAFFLLILCAALPQLLVRRMEGGPLDAWVSEAARSGIRAIFWPWAATANLLQSREVLPSLAIMAGWCALVGWFALWQFRRTLAFDEQAAGARGDTAGARTGFLEGFYRLPSAVFRDPLGALMEKEVRSLVRSPRFRLVFLMGFTFGLVIWLPIAFGRPGEGRALLGGNYLTVVSVYSLLLLSEVCFWNSFGFDRSAAQIYFLAPVEFSRVLIGKNISALLFVFLEIAAIAIVCSLLRMPLIGRGLAEAYAVALVISIFLLAAGNLISVHQARGVDPAKSFRSSAAGRVQALLLLIYPVASTPAGLAYLARYAFDSEAAFFGVLAFDAVVGLVFYKIALDSAVEAAGRIKEKMIAALSEGVGPIAA